MTDSLAVKAIVIGLKDLKYTEEAFRGMDLGIQSKIQEIRNHVETKYSDILAEVTDKMKDMDNLGDTLTISVDSTPYTDRDKRCKYLTFYFKYYLGWGDRFSFFRSLSQSTDTMEFNMKSVTVAGFQYEVLEWIRLNLN